MCFKAASMTILRTYVMVSICLRPLECLLVYFKVMYEQSSLRVAVSVFTRKKSNDAWCYFRGGALCELQNF